MKSKEYKTYMSMKYIKSINQKNKLKISSDNQKTKYEKNHPKDNYLIKILITAIRIIGEIRCNTHSQSLYHKFAD
jgi:hypothetical protein